MRRLTRAVVVLTCLVVPSWSSAQSSITGVVRDPSGAVLPGVSVEAASDVLIEKVRSAVTDETGQYRILELRPGTYTVTFTLTGFSTVKRAELELPADFVSTVNVEMRLGTLEETVTVTGESPIVDVQSARRRRTLDETLIESIPTAQGYAAVMVLMPSMVQSNGGNNNVLLSPGMIVFGGRGGRGNEGIAQTDGIGTGAAINGGGVSGYGRLDTTEEVVLTSSGGLGDVEVGGPIVNLIPRNGSNRFENRLQASGLDGSMQGDNFTQELKDAGLRTPAKTNYQWDASLMNSGPIMQDRFWFFYATRYTGTGSDLPGIFYNKNAGDITKWTYDPDFTSSGKQQLLWHDHSDAASDRAADVARTRWESSSTAAHSDSVTTRKSAVSGQSRWPRRRPALSVEADALRCSSTSGPGQPRASFCWTRATGRTTRIGTGARCPATIAT